ncbi:YceI family protein [Streptomyces umbrinus]|uniref:YceI family protein n=1 Tax=Streptomyces umbrinus TaxID=67370 RepID=UPI0027D83418|nr:YceI family protein [Streptomyces umbrinus]
MSSRSTGAWAGSASVPFCGTWALVPKPAYVRTADTWRLRLTVVAVSGERVVHDRVGRVAACGLQGGSSPLAAAATRRGREQRGRAGTVRRQARSAAPRSLRPARTSSRIPSSTGSDHRDSDVRSARFLFTDRHPLITFVSEGVDTGTVLGTLTGGP